MNYPLITDIQKYCIHDGHGIRTTVFFKGCPLTCRWCHNPETQSFLKQRFFDVDRCTGCGACFVACQNRAITIQHEKAVTDDILCTLCDACSEECLQNIRIPSGKAYSVDELVKELEKDTIFYEKSGGGVTLSGGEVFAQDLDYLEELLKKLWQKSIRVNADTCGYAPFWFLERLLPYIDTFLYDVKLIDANQHKKFTGVDNTLILDNLCQLSKQGASLWIRIPVIGGVNSSIEQMEQIAVFLQENAILAKQIHLLPYHAIASSKYDRLQMEYDHDAFSAPSADELDMYRDIFIRHGFEQVFIGG